MVRNLLNVALDVYRASFVDDGRGGRTRSTALHGNIRAMVAQASAAERIAAGQMGARLTHVVYTTPDADVQRGDELDAGGSRRLRVVSVVRNSRDTYLRLECEVVQGG